MNTVHIFDAASFKRYMMPCFEPFLGCFLFIKGMKEVAFQYLEQIMSIKEEGKFWPCTWNSLHFHDVCTDRNKKKKNLLQLNVSDATKINLK